MTQHRTPGLGLITAGLVAAAIGLSVQAAEPPARPAGGPGMQMQQEVERLHKDLNLDKQQEALFQAARDASRDAMREGMASRRENHEKMKAALEGPNPDLRALAAQMDKERDEHMQKHRQVRDAWLNFYDALNPAQKEKARHFIVARMDHMKQAMQERRPGMGRMPDRAPPSTSAPGPR